MKIITAFFAAFAFVLIAACGSDGGGGFTSNDQQPNATVDPADVSIDPGYHDAIDFSPAANPAEREQAYFQVAAGLSDPFIPKPNQDLVFDLIWEEAVDGNARIRITGMFEENGDWVERLADFRITRTAAGNWILKEAVKFDKTDDQLSLEYQERKKIEEETQRQEDIAGYQSVILAFDMTQVYLVSVEKIPDTVSPGHGIEGHIFNIRLENPTDLAHIISYSVDWTQVTFSPSTSKCSPDYRPIYRREEHKIGKVEVPAGGIIDETIKGTDGFFHQICMDGEAENIIVTVTKIDKLTREAAEEGLAKLQTSP